MITILIFADIIWIILFSTAWEHDSESESTSEEVQFWDSLWFVHGLVYVLAYLELILKGFLLYYLVVDFKEKYKRIGLECGYYIFRPSKKAETLYADEKVLDILGCDTFDHFAAFSDGSIKNIVIVKEREDVASKVEDINASSSYIGSFKFSITRRDGETRHLDSIGCRAYNGEEVVCFVYVVDITDIIE